MDFDIKSQPLYRSDSSGFKPVVVIHRYNFEHHILLSLECEDAKQSLAEFDRRSHEQFKLWCEQTGAEYDGRTILGFDMEWISWRQLASDSHRKYTKNDLVEYKNHVETPSKVAVCTIQLGCKDMSLIFCLPAIYANDHAGESPSLPIPLLKFLNGALTCFGGHHDLTVLRNNYPGASFDCEMWDPIITLKGIGAEYTNLLVMAKLLLDFESDKQRPDINWMEAGYDRLVSAGEDAILSYQLRNVIENPDPSAQDLACILTCHDQDKNRQVRITRVKTCTNPIIRKVMLKLSDADDGIAEKGYTGALTTFLATMKLPKMKAIKCEIEVAARWKCTVVIDLISDTLESTTSMPTKKEATNAAVKQLLCDSRFRIALTKFSSDAPSF